MVFHKSVPDYGWAVKVPFGTIVEMIGEKHIFYDFIPYRILF